MFTLSPADLKLRGLFSNLQGWLFFCKGKILVYVVLYFVQSECLHPPAPPTPLTVSPTAKRPIFTISLIGKICMFYVLDTLVALQSPAASPLERSPTRSRRRSGNRGCFSSVTPGWLLGPSITKLLEKDLTKIGLTSSILANHCVVKPHHCSELTNSQSLRPLMPTSQLWRCATSTRPPSSLTLPCRATTRAPTALGWCGGFLLGRCWGSGGLSRGTCPGR